MTTDIAYNIASIAFGILGLYYFNKFQKLKSELAKEKQIKKDWLIWANSCKTKTSDYIIPSEMRPLNDIDIKLLHYANKKTQVNDDLNGRVVYVCNDSNQNK